MSEGGDPELRSGCLADGDGARGPQSTDVDRVLADRRATLVKKRALRRRHAGAVLQILDPERHAGEWAGVVTARHRLVDGLGRSARQVGIEVN